MRHGAAIDCSIQGQVECADECRENTISEPEVANVVLLLHLWQNVVMSDYGDN